MAVKIYKIGDKVYHDYDKYISAMRGETTTTTKKPTTTSTIPKAPPPRRPEKGTDPRITPTTTSSRPTTTTSVKKTDINPAITIQKNISDSQRRKEDLDRVMKSGPKRSKPPTKRKE